MKAEFRRQKIVSGLLIALAVASSLAIRVPALAQPPALNGNVELDFTGFDVLIISDPTNDVGMPGTPPGVTGWEMKDLRLFYDAGTDTMYIGINVVSILGDADGDGDPSVTSAYLGFPSPPGLGGADVPNLSGSERAAVYFDLDQDSTWDVIAGISGVTDYSGFSVNNVTYPFSAAYSFGSPLLTHTGSISPNPSSTYPDLEFTITNWSALDASPGFTVGAHVGSEDDAGIGEDFLQASFGPAINIVKKTNGTDNNSPTGPYIAGGNTVTWTYNVTNPGSENLTNIVVTDDNGTPGNLADDWSPTYISGDDGDSILETTEAWIYQAMGTATAGQYANNATVTGDFDGFKVSDTDPDHYFGSAPCIHIEKSTNGQDADIPTGPYVAIGGVVTWTYNVTNCGSTNLTSIVVTDDNGTPGNLGDDWNPTYISGDDGDSILEITEAWIYQATGTAAAGQYANNSTVTGTPPVGANVSDDDPSHYFGSEACIHIEKSTNGQDADSPTGPYIPVGGVVTWVYNVTNCGSVNLTSIVVTDDNGTPGNLADDWSPTYISGDDGDSILETTEAWIYQAIGTAGAGQYANNSTVTGTPPVGSPVSDDDPSHYSGSEACIHIEKSTNGQDADSPTGPYIAVGGVVTWAYNVTNCGGVNLTSIVVTDDNGTPGNLADDWSPTYISGDDGDSILETTEAWIYQATGTAGAGQYANNSTVTGTPPVGSPVSDDDPSHYFGLGPAIDIEKHTNGEDADYAPGVYISVNSTVTWTYIVTNTGGVNLTGIVVTDDHLGVTPVYLSGDDGDGVLNPSEIWTYQAFGIAQAGQYANIGTVNGTPPVGPDVSDSDPSHYYNRPTTVGWETYPVNKLRVLLPWIGLFAAIIMAGATLLVLRRRRLI